MQRLRAIHVPFFAFLLSVPLSLCTDNKSAMAGLINNGGFESGFSDWTIVNQVGSDGTFLIQTGTTSPNVGDTVPAPPEGTNAAMSDAQGPGSHVLYQDFVVPNNPGPAELRFELFIGNRAETFFVPNPTHLDFSTADLNQQARVDILLAATDPFSVSASDVLLNVYQTNPGDPTISGYTSIVADLTSLFAANAGSTLRLRFAEVDNVFTFQLGVDDVDITVVPEPASAWLALFTIPAVACSQRRRRQRSVKFSTSSASQTTQIILTAK